MAYYFSFSCNKCGAEVKTSGPHEFKYSAGEIIALRHPGTSICDGLYFNAYCLTCKKNQDIVIVVFKTPGDPWKQKKDNIREEYLVNYQEQDKSTNEELLNDYPAFSDMTFESDTVFTESYRRDLTCPCCQKKNLVMFPDDGIKCPFCNDGFLISGIEILT